MPANGRWDLTFKELISQVRSQVVAVTMKLVII